MNSFSARTVVAMALAATLAGCSDDAEDGDDAVDKAVQLERSADADETAVPAVSQPEV